MNTFNNITISTSTFSGPITWTVQSLSIDEPQSLEDVWLRFISKKFPTEYSYKTYDLTSSSNNSITFTVSMPINNIVLDFSFYEPQSLEEYWNYFLRKKGLSDVKIV